MNGKIKLNFGLILLLVIPPALLEVLNNVYNLYVPVFIQSGSASFAAEGATLTRGFGMGALLVGFWMMADNLMGFFLQPYIGAWSDRTRNKRGRRIPFIIGTLPFIVLGYLCIPLIPRLIPPDLNGQTKQLIGFFILFTFSCIIYYIGYTPVRSIYQTLRQEVVDKDSRVKVESWYNVAMNLGTILAYTAGAVVYKIYGPLLFWLVLALYVISTIWLVVKFKEPEQMVQAAENQESSNLRQLVSVFRDSSKSERRNLILFLVSVTIFMIGGNAFTNFTASWAINTIGIDESKASVLMAVILVAMLVAILPAGYIAAGKFGRRNMYITGIVVLLTACVLLVAIPKMYMLGLVVLGFGMGICMPSQLPLVTEMTRNQLKLGSVIGIYNIFYTLGIILGAPVLGGIIQATSYHALFISMGGFMAIALVLFAFVRMPKAEVE